MTLERYRDAKRHIRYRLDGKLITAKQANEERANNPSLEFIDKVEPTVKKVVACSDQYTAIRQIEDQLGTKFFVDHTVKIEGGVFAKDDKGARLELYDNCVKVIINDKATVYELDISETYFIECLKQADAGTDFVVTGKSGKVYTYDIRTLEVLKEKETTLDETADENSEQTEPTVQSLTDYIMERRYLAWTTLTAAPEGGN